jgi:alpha-beta hydrolase superfamily lysophospholipase
VLALIADLHDRQSMRRTLLQFNRATGGAMAVACALLSALPGCGPAFTMVSHSRPEDSAKADIFGYRRWVSSKVDQDVVIIGIHGFCGASSDYANLGNHLLRHQPKTGLYAYDVRGQGSDPIRTRRGDIGDPKDWYNDLAAFTQLVEEQHPDARIVWYGESMGALIAAHSLSRMPPGAEPIDGLILSSPIVRFRDDMPAWKRQLIQVAAATFPNARVSLDALSGGQDVQMTQATTHAAQAETNDYHIEQHTLRLLGTLGRHIDGMNDCAATFRMPVLVLHGDQDYFNDDSDVRGFVARIPEKTSATYRNYPGSYHLLMYDAKKERIFRDVTRWVERLRRDRL